MDNIPRRDICESKHRVEQVYADPANIVHATDSCSFTVVSKCFFKIFFYLSFLERLLSCTPTRTLRVYVIYYSTFFLLYSHELYRFDDR